MIYVMLEFVSKKVKGICFLDIVLNDVCGLLLFYVKKGVVKNLLDGYLVGNDVISDLVIRKVLIIGLNR